MSRRVSARRARKAREIIQRERCEQRPSIIHAWKFSHLEDVWDYTRGTPPVEVYACIKCGAEL